MKNPEKKRAAMTKTSNTTPATRRAQAGNWLTVLGRCRPSVAEAVGSSGDCVVWAEPSLVDMLPSCVVTSDDKAINTWTLHGDRGYGHRDNGGCDED
jgi:hypothetical protein